MRKLFYLHPFVFGLFPILSLYAYNNPRLTLDELMLPVVSVVLLLLASWMLFALLLDDIARASVFASLTILWFFTFGHLELLILETDYAGFARLYPKVMLGIWWGLYFLIVLVALKWIPKAVNRTAVRVLNVVALGVILIPASQIIAYECSREMTLREMERRTRPARAGTTGPATRVQPNIFFIVLDGYGREDVLRGIYSYDNAPFLSELRRRGFRIMPSSHANYCQTLLSTSATLNAQYLPTLLPNVPETANDRLPLKQLLDQSSVIAFLRKRQYSTVGVSSGYEGTSVDKTDVSIRRETLLSRYHYALLRLTPLSFVISRPKGAPLNRYEEHRKAIRYALYTLGQLKDKRQPLFVFAHILSPHPPFVFKRDGTSRYSVRRYSLADASDFIDEGGTREEYLTQYPEQLHYTNLLVLEVLDQIRTNATRPTVIILQSDHGPGAHFIWRDPDHSNMTERFGILNAIAVPAGDPVPFYDTMSPVNTFRILFNYYFGTSLRTLPDESFFSSTTTPFRFLPVTHRILPHLPSQGAAE